MIVDAGELLPIDFLNFGHVASLTLKASRTIPRCLRIVLRKNRGLEVSMGPASSAKKPRDLQWAWRTAKLIESHLAITSKYATLWLNGTAFDVSLREAQAIRQTFEAHGLKIESAETASVANSSRAPK
jgi:hypothetical protein